MLEWQKQRTLRQVQLGEPQSKQLLQFEFKQLLLYGPSLNIYALPSISAQNLNKDSLSIWEAIIFVRHGCFKEGKFKFRVDFSCFPQHPPSITFTHPFHHSLINPLSGELDITYLLPSCWDQQNQVKLYHLMKNLPTIFTDPTLLGCLESNNPQAGRLFEEDPKQFTLRAMKSVRQSTQDQLDIFNIDPIPEGEKEEIKQKLAEVCLGQGGVEIKTQRFLKILWS